MLLPLDEPIDVPVEVWFPTLAQLVVTPGRLVLRTTHAVVVKMEGPAEGVERGTKVILDAGRERGLRIRGHVMEWIGDKLAVAYEAEARSDERASRRTMSHLGVRWRRVAEPGDVASWVHQRIAEPGPDTWTEAGDDVEFSMTGLRFFGESGLSEGDKLLMELTVPGSTTAWPCSATVRRVAPGEVAVEFSELPDGLADSLMLYALDLDAD